MDEPSGVDDDATRNAVRTVQRLRHLPLTGRVDAATLTAIRDAQPELEAIARARHCVVTAPLATRSRDCYCYSNPRPLIVLDIGHGYYRDDAGQVVKDTGTLAGGKPEAELNLVIGKQLAEKLRAEGFEVELTRTSDTQLLPSRFAARWAVGAGRKVFHISLHHESNPAIHGMVVYYSAFAPKDSPSIALARALADGGNVQPHRTDLINPFILGDTPSVLIELASLTHAQERKTVLSPEGQDALTSKLSGRIRDYYQHLQSTSLAGVLPPLGKSFLSVADASNPATPVSLPSVKSGLSSVATPPR